MVKPPRPSPSLPMTRDSGVGGAAPPALCCGLVWSGVLVWCSQGVSRLIARGFPQLVANNEASFAATGWRHH